VPLPSCNPHKLSQVVFYQGPTSITHPTKLLKTQPQNKKMETHNNLVQSDQDLLGKIIVKYFRAMVDGLDFMKKKKEGSG
jgi:hypothetical protein